MAEAGAQGTHWPRSRNGTTAGGKRRGGGGGRLHVANLRRHCGSRRRAADFARGAIRFLRGSGSTVPGSKSTLIRLAVCRSPSPPSPMRKWMTADVPGSAEGASHEGTWQTQIDLHDRPCRVHPRCGHLSLPGAPSLLGRDPPYSSSIPPRLSPPTSTHPSVRLHRTMSLCGTHRVCVPECPPLGRPSYNKVGPYQ